MNRDSPSMHSPPLSGPVVGLLALPVLAGGLALWLHFGAIEFVYGWQRGICYASIVVALLALFLPRDFIASLGRLARTELSPWQRRLATIAIGLIGTAITAGVFISQEGDPTPSVCDEYSYLIQAQMLSRLHLWGPGHELPQFFITFQLVADPVYGSIYLPGTALWFAPWALLDRIIGTGDGTFVWIAPLIATVISLGLTYRCVAELLKSDLLGLLAVVVLMCVPMYRASAHMMVGQAVSTMFCLLVIYAFLKWRHGKHPYVWALVAGVSVSWGLLSRPMDVLAYSLPVLALVALPLLSRRAVDGIAWRTRGVSVLIALSTAIPFVLFMSPLNKAMSGSYLQTSFGWYAETYLPGTAYGFDVERPLDAVPPNSSPDYQLSYRNFTRRFIRDHNELSVFDLFHKRFSEQLITSTPHALMLATALGPLLLLVLRPRETWRFALLLGLPWFLSALLYLPYGFYLGQYAVATAPSMSAAIASGALAFALALGIAFSRKNGEPNPLLTNRASVATAILVAGCLLGLSTRGIRGMANTQREDWYQIPELRYTDQAIAAEVETPAVIFFTPPPFDQPEEAEPVYNLNVMSPDNADAIRAHDRGWENADLVAYYARTQPNRRIYHFDRRDRTIIYLGIAGEMAKDAESIETMRLRFNDLSAWWRPLYRQAITDYDATFLEIDPVDMPVLNDYPATTTRPTTQPTTTSTTAND